MQRLQNSVFSILKTTSLSPGVFSFLQPSSDNTDQTPLGGILRDTKYGWLALGNKFCVVDLRSGVKIAARNFNYYGTSANIFVTNVVELPTPLSRNTQQLIISLECGDTTGMICVFNIFGSQLLRCIQTDVVVTKLSLTDGFPIGPFSCFDSSVIAGTRSGEIFVFDLNRSLLVQALKEIVEGYDNLIRGEDNPANLIFLPLKSIHKIERHRDTAVSSNDNLAVLLNEKSFVDGQYMFCNPDSSVRMQAKRDHIRVTVVEYLPQLGSVAVGFNFGAFQIWNLLELELEFTSQVNVECLPVTHFGFQEPCDDPRAFCYLWVIFSVIDRREDEEFPLAVMYSLSYQGKRMLSDTSYLYEEFSTATVRFQIELGSVEHGLPLVGGRCISCHTYSINSTLAEEGEDTMLNLCQLVWECWGENIVNTLQHGMLLFDLDQWYKDQMPATQNLESNTFMSTALSPDLGRGINTLDLRLDPTTVSSYSHATRLEEHFYPNSLQYSCVCLNTSEVTVVHTVGIQRQIVNSIWEAGPSCLLRPANLHAACLAAGLTPLYGDVHNHLSPEDQRRFLLSVALEARLAQFLLRCAQDWATGTHSGVGCTLTFLTDWCWKRAIELKENAKELTGPLFTLSTLPDKNVIRCLEHCVQQLNELTGLMDGVLTKCCNLVVPNALSEIEEKYAGIGTVALYFQVVQWFLRVGLLPERAPPLPYPAQQLHEIYYKRRLKLHRLQEQRSQECAGDTPCELLYIDQLIENEFGGEKVYSSWRRISGDAESAGLYPPPSLCALARLYLRPDVHHDHKHALLLYLLLDYCMLYDDIRYETIIRKLMQFPTMFGLSNTAIKATQAFWHLDHRDFDFALDQLQCLTGNTLSDWQHKVVLSALLAQKKHQAALQYLHVRKPPPVQRNDKDLTLRSNEYDKLEDWRSCCNLYLARSLVFEALEVLRTRVRSASTVDEKKRLLTFLYEGCRKSGLLSKVLQVSLLPFEEEVFINYLQECNNAQTSDILILYYLQQARYLEAEAYSEKMRALRRHDPSKVTEVSEATAALVDVACRAIPRIATEVARTAAMPSEHPVIASKPISVFVQATSPKNFFTYKSSFIQNTIDSASETWINRPSLRKGIKRALEIEETPFICTPKLSKTRSLLSSLENDCDPTPSKRAKLDRSGGAKSDRPKVSEQLSGQVAALLDIPEVQSPVRPRHPRADTPHSILKSRRLCEERDLASPMDSRYLGDSDDECEVASNHTHASDKHLRFTIPTESEAESTPSPVPIPVGRRLAAERRATDDDTDHQTSANAHKPHPMESPPKKFAAEEKMQPKKTYKDSVRARKSLSISVNSSLSEDLSTSVESIADISVTLLNPNHPRHRTTSEPPSEDNTNQGNSELEESFQVMESSVRSSPIPRTPKARRSIRTASKSPTPSMCPSRKERSLVTPERQDSPIVTRLDRPRASRARSRSRTPELSPKAVLAPIPEQPKQEVESKAHTPTSAISFVRQLRSRTRIPERIDTSVAESPRLEAILELPTTSTDSPQSSPTRRNLRSRSRTPEVEMASEQLENIPSPRSLRSRSKTPDKLMSPKKENARSKKSLSRLVLEANTFSKTKQQDKTESECAEKEDNFLECTPMKPEKSCNLMDINFSPIVNKSVLQHSSGSLFSLSADNITQSEQDNASNAIKSLPEFTISETDVGKSLLQSYQSGTCETSTFDVHKDIVETQTEPQSLPAFTTIYEAASASVLKSCDSSVAESSTQSKGKVDTTSFNIKSLSETGFGKSVLSSYESSAVEDTVSKEKNDPEDNSGIMTSDSEIDVSNKNWKPQSDNQDSSKVIQKEKERIVEIEREINEIEDEMAEDECREVADSGEEIEQSNESSDSSNSENDGPSGNNEDVIFIEDSDDSHSSSYKLEICEGSLYSPPALNTQNLDVVEEIEIEEEAVVAETVTTDALNSAQISMLTDDASIDRSGQFLNLNYSADIQPEAVDMGDQSETKNEPNISIDTIQNPVVTVETSDKTAEIPPEVAVNDDVTFIDAEHKIKTNQESEENKGLSMSVTTNIDKGKIQLMQVTTEDDDRGEQKEAVQIMEFEVNQQEVDYAIKEIVRTDENKELDNDKTEKKQLLCKKPIKSTSSNKSECVELSEAEPKTPMTRKRTQSNSSVTITDQKTPEDIKTAEVSTPTSRIRPRTPTSTEVRRILTRRASKELSESITLDVPSEEILTPRRRSTRATSKKDDDNVVVASESSSKSIRSRASEEKEVKAAPIRKGRRSILNTKTDLTVIPEASTEEPKIENVEDIIKEYSSVRLTRHQRGVLNSLVDASTSQTPPPQRTPRRRASRSDRGDELPATENKDGCSALDETPPDTTASSAKPRRRLARAVSDTKLPPKAERSSRRLSVDVVASPDTGSPSAASARGRRASFTRAAEAIQSPHRRQSTDQRAEAESAEGSPAHAASSGNPATPSRRPRRVSATSATKPSKKT